MNLRPYQPAAANYLARRLRGMVKAPAGSGKTIIAAAALNQVLTAKTRTTKPHIGWIANTNEQATQAINALAFSPDIMKLATVTVRCAAAGQDWSSCACLLVDECHHGPAPEWRRQIETCTGAVWGLTATPPEPDDERHADFCQIFCPPDQWHTITREEVGQSLAHARVTMLDASDDGLRGKIDADIEATMRWRRRYHRGSEQELWGQVAWQSIINHGIVNNRSRNQAAIQAAMNHRSGSVIVLINQIEQAKEISAQIPESQVLHSKLPKKKRDEVVQKFRDGSIWCIVASSICDEGFDAPRTDTIVMISGGRSKRLAEQRTGRALRSFAGKTHGTIYDFTDEFHPLAAKQSKARQEVYRSLGYEFSDELPANTGENKSQK